MTSDHLPAGRLRELTHEARASLLEDLESLTPEQWRQPSLCGRWDVEHVVAHLTAGASVGPWRWVASIVAAGFRPAVHNERRLREHLGATPAETLERFRAVVGSTTTPSKHLVAYLGEALVHGQDIRYPLGLAAEPPVEALTPVAGFFAKRDFTVDGASLTKGLALRAHDGTFAAGEGPQVAGSTLALVMTMAGRNAYLDHLEGPGAAELRRRVEARA